MNLIIDIGNTRTKLGVFDKSQLHKKIVLKDRWTLAAAQPFLKIQKIQRIALSSVAEVNPELERYFKAHYYYLALSAKTPLPISNLYKSPKTLGKDRIAAVVGAQALYPQKACLVIDAGTCITYDILDAEGAYHGGNIAPGVTMRLKAMHSFTARLPLVQRRKKVETLVGNTTTTALRTGGQLGAVYEMAGFIKAYKQQFGRLNVILTGGDADFFANHLKTKIFVNHNLVLVGLNKILNYNVHKLD